MFKTFASLVLISLVTAPPSVGLKYTVHMEAHQSAAAAQDPMAAQMNAMMAPMMMQVFPSGGLDQTVTIGEKATRTEQRQSFAGLPATTVIVGSHDPLHDDGVSYADALREAGVDVQLIEYPAMPHGFLNFPRFARDAETAMAAVVDSQRSALG